ncbi:MAG: glucose dehydrogenase [Proteobacteria bacterium]|nr:MAG: glucose dehydrogenase [Pseudomonadota bacterium]
MRAISVLPKSRELRVQQIPEPRLEAPSDVRLRMIEVGVCGTDREICAFEYGTPPAGCDHLVLGHESLAQVESVGPGVTELRPGDWVVPMVRRPCPHAHCVACRRGRQDFCFTGDFRERGIQGAHGFMTELVVEDERYLVPVPAGLADVAVLVEPLTIAEKALLQLWHVQERLPWECPHRPGKDHGHCRRALVLGAGPVGLLGALALRAADFETIVYAREERPSPKADWVEAIGAIYVSAREQSPSELAARHGAIDVVYEAAGASQVAFEAMQSLGANAVFVFTGVPGRKSPVPIDTDGLMRQLVLRNQIVFGTVNAGRDAFEAAVRDLGRFEARWPGALRALISGRHPLEAHRELLLGRPAGIKHVLAIGAPG